MAVVAAGRYLAEHLRGVRHAAGNEVGITTVAAADEDILGSVENQAATAIVQALAGLQAGGTLRHQAAVIPVDFHLGHGHLGHVVAGGEHVLDILGIRGAVREQQSGAALDLDRIQQVEGLESRLQDVAGHVAQGAGTEIPPATEVPRRIDGVVRTHGSRTDEAIPVHRGRNGHLLLGTREALGPDGTVGKGIHAGHLADLPVPNPFAERTDTGTGSALVTHLGSHFVLGGQFGEQAGFIDRVRKRFLHIDMLAGLDGLGGDAGVGMVGRGHYNRIRALQHLVIHLPVIAELLRLRIRVEHAFGIVPVRIAQTDDVLSVLEAVQVGITPAADTDGEDVEFVARSSRMAVGLSEDGARGHAQPQRGDRTRFQERTAGNFFLHIVYQFD